MSARAVSLRVKRQGRDTAPIIYARWRAPDGRQVERRVGAGWLVKQGEPGGRPNGTAIGDWRVRSGRAPEGFLTPDAARERVPEVLDAWAREADETREAARRERDRKVTFADAAGEWLRRRERKGCKPSTMRDYRVMLAPAPDGPADPASGRIMRRFGDVPVADVARADVRAFLDAMESDGLSPRTINKTRQVLWAIFEVATEHAERDGDGRRVGGGFGVAMDNPVPRDSKRRQDSARRLEVFSPADVAALARAAEAGLHRDPPENLAEKVARQGVVAGHGEDRQDAALFTVAALAGLRMGELLALRWRDVDFAAERISVFESYAAGQTTAPKSGRSRSVPMARQAAEALARLSQRPMFTAPGDLVFCGRDGRHLDGSALRRRFVRARDAAGLRPLRFHDLRHTFGTLAARQFGVRAVQELMGHAQLATTAKYMHYLPAADEAERLSRAFEVAATPAELLAPEAAA